MVSSRGPASYILPPDLHIHTMYSEHASGTMEETVRSAIAKGMTEMGFADHFPYPPGFSAPAPNCVIPDEGQFTIYADEVRRLQSAYAERINVRFGAEIDYLGEPSSPQKSMRHRFAFDYVIGSVHIVQNVAIDYQEEMLLEHLDELGGVEKLWEAYWDRLERLVREDDCHIIGHLDILKKYDISISRKDHRKRVRQIFQLMKNKNMAIEVNTGGIDRASDRRPYPSISYLELAAEMELYITLGSDAHSPQDVGRYFGETVEMLKSLGWKGSMTFNSGQKLFIPFAS